MKKLLISILLLSTIGQTFAEIAVKSFRRLENDLDARVTAPIKDFNGDQSAIIKVVTTQSGFSFDCGQIGIVKTVIKPGEIWVYVPYGAKRMTISHPQLGLLRDYQFPESTEKATVYELVLLSGKIEQVITEGITTQWVMINPEPADAMIYIDDLFVKCGVYQAKLKPGSYTYRVEAPSHHSDAGKFEVVDKKVERNIKLKPAIGSFAISSKPEAGAKVIIDGKLQSSVTPYNTEALGSGEHTVQVVKEMYLPLTKKVTIVDGAVTPIEFELQPNFAQITITTPNNAMLYINNEKKCTGTFSGRLSPTIYSLEARIDKHRSAKMDVELKAGEMKTIDLQPTPIYGSLDIMTTPPGANIIIDGKDYGTTPNSVDKLLIGDYKVTLTKTGFANSDKTITIEDGKSSLINETMVVGEGVAIASTPIVAYVPEKQLPTKPVEKVTDKNDTPPNMRMVSINSNPSDAALFIDGNSVGKTPYNTPLSYGIHQLRIEVGDKRIDKTVTVEQYGGDTNFKLSMFNKMMNISSNPSGAAVYIDGKYIGKSPLNTELSLEKHSIKVVDGDKSNKMDLNVEQQSSPTLFFQLAECNAIKQIGSTPSGATVSIADKVVGMTPYIYNMSTKSEDLVIKQKGYVPYKQTLTCEGRDVVSADLIQESKQQTLVLIQGGIACPLLTDASGSVATDNLGYQFRFGVVKTAGWYIKASYHPLADSKINSYNYNDNSSWYYSSEKNPKSDYERTGFATGLLLNANPVIFYAGAGFGSYKRYIRTNLYSSYSNILTDPNVQIADKNSFSGLETDFGMILNMKPISVSFGGASIDFKYYEFNLGVGFIF